MLVENSFLRKLVFSTNFRPCLRTVLEAAAQDKRVGCNLLSATMTLTVSITNLSTRKSLKLFRSKARVCKGQGLALVADVMFRFGPDLGMVQKTAVKSYVENFGLFQAIFFRKNNYSYLVLVAQSGSGNKFH